jgi:predicted RNase H-like nuclease (RuvC/YqgF family)
MDVHLGIEGTNSNGHGEGRDENMNMVETIKNLQRDVQSHKDDNESLMRSKEQHDDFNMKLLEILNRIENKLDKESGSSKSGSHKSPDGKRKARSVRKHHYHSPRHSNKR